MTELHSQEWFVEMGKRIKARDHAKQMVTRWQTKVSDAETAITELSAGLLQTAEVLAQPNLETVYEQVPE